MEPQSQETCHVCFVKPYTLLDYSQIIRCKSCGLTCHKSCYLPSLKKTDFLCDQCASSPKQAQCCFICGNQGLLKKVQDYFAHPICLLFSQQTIVVDYSNLSFALVKKTQGNRNKKKCSICNKKGELEKCFAECQNEVHLYCAWKSFHQERGWNHNTLVQSMEYSRFYEKKVKQYVSSLGKPVVQCVGSFGQKSSKKARQFELVCHQHLQNLFQCCTQDKYFKQTNISYIQCDQCLKWYHRECLDFQILLKDTDDPFVCPYCHNFWKLINSNSQSQVYLKKFPRLNICQLIYIQYLFEQKKYFLTKREVKFLFTMPIQPSVVFVETLIRKNVKKKLKVEHFKTLCRLDITKRLDRKKMKESLKEKFQTILKLMVNKTSLHQLREQGMLSISIKSEQDLQFQQRNELRKWTKLLFQFKKENSQFDAVLSELIKKLNHWYHQLSEQNSNVQSHQFSNNSPLQQSASTKQQQRTILHVKKQQESLSQEIESKTPYEVLSKQLKNSKVLPKFEQDESPGPTFISLDQQEGEDFEFINPVIERKIRLMIIRMRRYIKQKKINNQNINLLKVSIKKHDKYSFFQTIIDEELSTLSALRYLLLESSIKMITDLIEPNKPYQKEEEDLIYEETKIIFTEGNSTLSKRLGHTRMQKSVLFVKRWSQQVMQFYLNSNDTVKQKLKSKLQFTLKSLNNFITTCELEQNSSRTLSFDEILQNILKPSSSSISLKSQINRSLNALNAEELKLIRLEIQKKNASGQVKQIEFTRYYSNQMGQKYESYLQSSSEMSESPLSTKKEENLRPQILQIQKQMIGKWIKMFGLLFQLSSRLTEQQRKKNQQYQQRSILSESKQYLMDKEPLEIIQYFLSRNYTKEEILFQKYIAHQILRFVNKVLESKLNYRIYHPSLSSIVEEMGRYCLQFSCMDDSFWKQNQSAFQAMRYLHKTFRNKNYEREDKKYSAYMHKLEQVFQKDEFYSDYLWERTKQLFIDPEITEKLYIQTIPLMTKFYTKQNLIFRVNKVKRIKVWMIYYFKILSLIRFELLVDQQFCNSDVLKKYSPRQKLSFNQLQVIKRDLHKIQFIECKFSKRIFAIYQKACLIQKQVQRFFTVNCEAIDKSYILKEQFLKTNNIEQDCITFKTQFYTQQTRLSSAQYKSLIKILEDNQCEGIVTFELEILVIKDLRQVFKKEVKKAEEALISRNQLIPLKELNLLFLKIIAFPFYYKNLNIFRIFLEKRAQRQSIFRGQQNQNLANQKRETIQTNQFREKQLSKIEKAYQELLSEFKLDSKMICRNLNQDEIIKKINQIKKLQGYSSAQSRPFIRNTKEKIFQKVEYFNCIKSRVTKFTQKIDENKILEHQQIEELDRCLSAYKMQRICEYSFQILSNKLEVYKLAFSAIPANSVHISAILEQLKDLKPQFMTREVQKRIKDLKKMVDIVQY